MVPVEESSSYISNLIFPLQLLLTAVIGALSLYHFWFQSLRYTKLGNKLPGYTPLPILGDGLAGLNKSPKDILNFIVTLAQEKGNIYRLWFGDRLTVGLIDPKDVELILGSNKHLEKSTDYDFFKPWLGDGLLISKGEKWRSHRKMIAPTFHQSILKTFMPIFNKNATDLVKELRADVLGKICDVHDYMAGATVDVLLETVMGAKKTKEAKSSFKYAKAVMDMCALLHYRHTRFWMRSSLVFRFSKMFKEQVAHLNIIHTLTDKVIQYKKKDYFQRRNNNDGSLYKVAAKETEEELNQTKTIQDFGFGNGLRDDLDEDDEDVGEKKRLAFLDFLIEASHTEGNKLSDTEIREQVSTIMFEGHDTTAAATSFFLCMLGVYPEIQEKVYQELREIFQDTDRPVTFNDTMEMKYMERVLLETLRLYSPVPFIARTIRQEIKLASADYILPEGAAVIIPIFSIHRNPEFYPNPLKFDPDNFLPEKCQQRPYYSFVPFSAGPRSCVGRKYAMLKMKVLLATLVRNFKITSPVPEKDFELQGDIILKRADGFRVILENRA